MGWLGVEEYRMRLIDRDVKVFLHMPWLSGDVFAGLLWNFRVVFRGLRS